MTSDIETRAKAYAEHNEIVLMSTGMPETHVELDGVATPIQCAGCGYRLSALSWAHSEGWGEIDQVVEDDGQIGAVTWRDGEPVKIDWRDLTDDELDSVPGEDDEWRGHSDE